jgi:hypothetical protein
LIIQPTTGVPIVGGRKMKIKALPLLFFFCAAALTQQNPGPQARISIPGTKGVLEINVGRAEWTSQVRPDGQAVELQVVAPQGQHLALDQLMISARLQRVDFSASAEKCRDEWWPKIEKQIRDHWGKPDALRRTSKDGIARVEFVPVIEGAKLNHPELSESTGQKLLYAYLGNRDLCAEVFLSKAHFQNKDQRVFDETLSSVRLLPDESGTKTQVEAGKNEK